MYSTQMSTTPAVNAVVAMVKVIGAAADRWIKEDAVLEVIRDCWKLAVVRDATAVAPNKLALFPPLPQPIDIVPLAPTPAVET
jgi:hypothetical protein